MYPVIIVEDEPILLNGLVKLVECSGTGFEVAGKAADGLEALELITTLSPALVITDIRMPKIDGLELTAWIHNEQPDIKVIIVTGYSDFNFAQQAIRCGVMDFLLKPVKKDELNKALTKVKAFMNNQLFADSGLVFEPKLTAEFEELVKAIQLLDHIKAAKAASEFWNLFNKEHKFPWHFKLQLASHIFENIQKRFPDVIITSDMVWIDGLFLLQPNDQLQLEQYFVEQIKMLISKIATQRSSVGRQAVSKAKEFIETNYASDIGLKEVAEAVYLNSSYFSQVFKEITGENFINYLTKIRIEKAVVLLKQSELKIYEITKAVGYNDQAYFSRIFKQIVGVNPIEYRRRLGI
jgi:two-component system, response regulator YesN